jgi:CRISPR-associated protein Cas1
VRKEEKEVLRLPLHNLEGIVTFGYTGASPALMGACAKRNISLCFLSAYGSFRARVVGKVQGNVVLRKNQYEASENEEKSLILARHMVAAKLYNARWVVERAGRDHSLRLDTAKLKAVSASLKTMISQLPRCQTLEQVRGNEGNGAKAYFSVLDDLILQQKEDFIFEGRNRRPPLDNVNAMLSFTYTLLTNEMTAALETVGLDPYVGFLHRDRPGRASLALDLIEELRPVFADRFVLTLINKREVSPAGFNKCENGAVVMEQEQRKQILAAWQRRKQEEITHPYLGERVQWGLTPYIQAMLLARYLRGDLDAYPPFFWK